MQNSKEINETLNQIRFLMKKEIDNLDLDELFFLGKVLKDIKSYKEFDSIMNKMIELWQKK
jgi:hypothetical protein